MTTKNNTFYNGGSTNEEKIQTIDIRLDESSEEWKARKATTPSVEENVMKKIKNHLDKLNNEVNKYINEQLTWGEVRLGRILVQPQEDWEEEVSILIEKYSCQSCARYLYTSVSNSNDIINARKDIISFIKQVREEGKAEVLREIDELFMYNSGVGQSVIYADDFLDYAKQHSIDLSDNSIEK